MNKKLKKITTTLSLLVIVYLVSNISGVTGFGFDPGGDDPPADTTPPTVSITSPSNGATITSSFYIQVSASDSSGILKVRFYIDGQYIGEDLTAPYKKYVNKAGYSDGQHSIRATAFDGYGNTASKTIYVTFYTPDETAPDVELIYPVSPTAYPPFTEVSGTITIIATASDNVAVDYVSFSMQSQDSLEWFDLGRDYSGPYEKEVDTTLYYSGYYLLKVEAVDTSGNSATDMSYITIVFIPRLEITSPGNGNMYGQSITFDWNIITEPGDPDLDYYQVSLDDGSWTNVGTAESHTFNGLTQGYHRFYVWAEYESGFGEISSVAAYVLPTGSYCMEYESEHFLEWHNPGAPEIFIASETVSLKSKLWFDFDGATSKITYTGFWYKADIVDEGAWLSRSLYDMYHFWVNMDDQHSVDIPSSIPASSGREMPNDDRDFIPITGLFTYYRLDYAFELITQVITVEDSEVYVNVFCHKNKGVPIEEEFQHVTTTELIGNLDLSGDYFGWFDLFNWDFPDPPP